MSQGRADITRRVRTSTWVTYYGVPILQHHRSRTAGQSPSGSTQEQIWRHFSILTTSILFLKTKKISYGKIAYPVD